MMSRRRVDTFALALALVVFCAVDSGADGVPLGPAQGAGAQAADAAARSRAASEAMSAGRFDEAARTYRELTQAMPDQPGLLMDLGMALAMGGHEAEAIAPLERAIALNPSLLPARLFLGTSYLALGQPAKAVAPLERVVAARPTDVENRRMLAQAYGSVGRTTDAVAQLRRITELAPRLPAGWYALGHAYNALTQDAMATFDSEPAESPWRQLLVADALLADGRMTDAFALYRATLARLPALVTVHDAIARIYEATGHADWAARERAAGVLPPAACATRKALCEFRAGRYRPALSAALAGKDPESRYWRARAATELALASFKRLDDLPDSRERREVRATIARAERRYTDAVTELQVALQFAPGDPALVDDLGTAYYFAHDYQRAVDTLMPILKVQRDDPRLLTVVGDSLLQLERVDEALPMLQRAVERDRSDSAAALTLGRAYAQKGEYAAAISLMEPRLNEDHDGSLHVQLARAYTALGHKEKGAELLQQSQEIQRTVQEKNAASAQRAITPPEK